ncbi:MAG: bifunctional diaminohydroxyphosphoribosylaminopyrimidine deaminase/5-amino-6-(5-phosphoribosylamino)uracil reductase RibD [Muribaculaceae bacterium]|nr:bifunctional diaminohydroxyphosphoribosylaminopyrimidine deaminase/5-amino-6-(5-phosphoribosylamino)uracil reductase RibD [Muribaculaceae bacterium]
MTDEDFMARALQLARLGEYSVSPNPMVGAVVVCDGKIIGEGYHRCYGKAHAEVNAIASVADRSLLAKSVIYVTLEPCSHYGKTPPCAELIINSGIKNVIVGALDPFEKVRGRGVEMLRKSGISVKTGVLEAECKAVNRRFMTAHIKQRPFVCLKWAQSADGFIARLSDNGVPYPIAFSSKITKTLMHCERAKYDAIMVGSNTVVADNPTLTVRRWCGNNPLRVVLDRREIIPLNSNVFNSEAKTLVFGNSDKYHIESENVDYCKIDNSVKNIIDFILAELYSRNISSLMVEGGAELLSKFIEADSWDCARIEKSPLKIEKGVAAPIIKGVITNVEKHSENIICHINHSQNHKKAI